MPSDPFDINQINSESGWTLSRIESIRSRILNKALRVYLVVGPLLLMFCWLVWGNNGWWDVLGVHTATYVLGMFVYMLRAKLDFNSRAIIVILSLFVFSIYMLCNFGIWGLAPYYMLTVCVFCSVFFKFRHGFVCIGLYLCVLLIIGLMINAGVIIPNNNELQNYSVVTWVFGALMFLCVAMALIYASGMVQQDLRKSLSLLETRTSELLVRQSELRSLASKLTLVEEKERKKIALLLHDGIGQTLAVTNIKLKMLAENLESEEQQDEIGEITDYIETMIDEARSLTFDLSPPTFHMMSFTESSKWLFNHYTVPLKINSEFAIRAEDFKLREDIKVLLFNCYRELLVNMTKYSKASRVKGFIEIKYGRLRLGLADNGLGFSSSILSSPKEDAGFGLFSIRERMHYFNGELELISSPGNGVQAVLIAPLRKKDALNWTGEEKVDY